MNNGPIELVDKPMSAMYSKLEFEENPTRFDTMYYDMVRSGEIEEATAPLLWKSDILTRGVPGLKLYKHKTVAKQQNIKIDGLYAFHVKIETTKHEDLKEGRWKAYRFWSPFGVHAYYGGSMTVQSNYRRMYDKEDREGIPSYLTCLLTWQYIHDRVLWMWENYKQLEQNFINNDKKPLGEVVY
jgi:hypothetical protein